MGIFDFIELKNHCQAIGEYILYLDAHRDEFDLCTTMMQDHIKKMFTLLAKYDKDT